MDYFPKPTNHQPGIDVPLMELVPITARLPTQPGAADQETEHWIQHKMSWGETFLIPVSDRPRITNNDAAFENWFAFPKRLGLLRQNDLDEPPVLALDRTTHTVRFATLLQSWAFFGLIEIFCEKPVQSSIDWSYRRTPGNTDDKYLKWPEDFLADFLARIKAPEWKEPGPPKDFSSRPPAEHFKAHNDPGSSSCKPGSRLEAAAMLVINVCYEIERNHDEPNLQSSIPEIALSVRLLCEAIHDLRSELGTLGSKLLAKKLCERGWCPSVAYQTTMSSPRGTLQAYYLYTLSPRAQKHEEDSYVSWGDNHTACDEQVCRSSNTEMGSSYRTRHTRPLCKCTSGSVDTTILCDIILRGKIPLLQMQKSRGKIHISLTEARPADEFTAISHVWAQGLGNPRDNSLPQCQIDEIWTRVERLPKVRQTSTWAQQEPPSSLTIVPGFLELDCNRYQIVRRRLHRKPTRLVWMDTLCIPAGSARRVNKARNEAVNRMIMVYACASQVMVLDQTLLELHLANTTFLELYAKIATMPWMHRSWTYQEGSIASYCCFECADGSVSARVFRSLSAPSPESFAFYNLSALLKVVGLPTDIAPLLARTLFGRLRGFPAHNFRRPTPPDALTTILHERFYSSVLAVQRASGLSYGTVRQELRGEYSPAITKMDAFVSTWNELARRSTTKTEDAYLIFANVLGYNPRHLGDELEELRIFRLLASMEVLPVNLLFTTGPRYRNPFHPRHRWVPSAISRMPLTRISESPLRYKAQGMFCQDSAHWWRPQSRFPSLERMRFAHGSLWLQSEAAPELLLIIIDQAVARTKIMHLELTPNRWCQIEFDPNVELDAFDCNAYGSTCLLLEPNRPFGYARGARLYMTDQASKAPETGQEWNGLKFDYLLEASAVSSCPLKIAAVYDCPLRYCTIRPEDPRETDAVVVKHEAIQTWKNPKAPWRLEIKCGAGVFSQRKPLVARPEIPREQKGWGNVGVKLLPVTLSLYLWFLIRTILRVVIAIRRGWQGTTSFYKASTVTWLLVMPPPVSEILLVLGQTADRPLTSLEKIWVGWSIGVSVPLALFFILSFYAACNMTYNAWARSFDKDWPSSQDSWQHRFAFDFERDVDIKFFKLQDWIGTKALDLLPLSKKRKASLTTVMNLKKPPVTSDESQQTEDSDCQEDRMLMCRQCKRPGRRTLFEDAQNQASSTCWKCLASGHRGTTGPWLVRTTNDNFQQSSWMRADWRLRGARMHPGSYYINTATRETLKVRPWERDGGHCRNAKIRLAVRQNTLIMFSKNGTHSLGKPMVVWPIDPVPK